MGKKSGSGSGMNNPNQRELRNHFVGLKYLNSLMWIRDKHPGSATLIKLLWEKFFYDHITVPDP
jgi:uncharacterized membrane protein YdcZ (DUF606 family)